jgi:2-hydroxychromene-2-carboxylate isomerase
MTPPIDFFFDFSSPYGYVASERTDKLAGSTPQHTETGTQSEDYKRQLCAVNDEARAQGVFGSPFRLINQELFWGADRFRHLYQQLSRGSW